jgi:hypothetical protein
LSFGFVANERKVYFDIKQALCNKHGNLRTEAPQPTQPIGKKTSHEIIEDL